MGGGDKARIRIGGKTILERVLATMTPQCARLIINANGDPARFADTGLPVVADSIPDFAGPLAGILAGLDWAAAHAPGHRRRRERAGRLPVPAVRPGGAARRGAGARPRRRSPARAPATGGIRWWGCGRWRCARICARRSWSRACTRSRSGPRATASPLPTGRRKPVDPFFNVNTPEDVAAAERVAAQERDA